MPGEERAWRLGQAARRSIAHATANHDDGGPVFGVLGGSVRLFVLARFPTERTHPPRTRRAAQAAGRMQGGKAFSPARRRPASRAVQAANARKMDRLLKLWEEKSKQLKSLDVKILPHRSKPGMGPTGIL